MKNPEVLNLNWKYPYELIMVFIFLKKYSLPCSIHRKVLEIANPVARSTSSAPHGGFLNTLFHPHEPELLAELRCWSEKPSNGQ